jgi:membrane peptidoglycan carboxypeptidase
MKKHQPTTHERYLHAVRDAVITRAQEKGTITAEQAEQLAHTRMPYGVGDGTDRGVTVFEDWETGSGGSTSSKSRPRARSRGYSLPAQCSTTC